MDSIGKRYDVHGLSLAVEAESPALANGLDGLVGGFTVPETEAGSYSVRLSYGELPPPPEAGSPLRVFHRGSLACGIGLTCWTGGPLRRYDLEALASVRVDLDARRAEVLTARGREWCVREWCGLLALTDLLADAGHYIVHAAVVADGPGEAPPAVLLSGVGGRGKTTAALALARSGMRLLTDDAGFLTGACDGPPRVWGLPTRCKVTAATRELLPWLASLPAAANPARPPEERIIDPYPAVGGHWRGLARPAAVFLLEEHNDGTHRVGPLGKDEAMVALTRENVRARDARSAGGAGRAFAALAALVREAETYRLSVGADLAGLAGAVRGLLR